MTKRAHPKAKNLVGEVKCPGCNFKSKILFARPRMWVPKGTDFECETCKSIVRVLFRLPLDPKIRKEGGFEAFVKIKTPSELLLEMQREDAEQRDAQVVEEFSSP